MLKHLFAIKNTWGKLGTGVVVGALVNVAGNHFVRLISAREIASERRKY